MIGSSSDPLVDEDMEEILRSGVLDDEPPHQSPLLGDEQISAEDGSVLRDVKGMPAPRQPTRDEVSRHDITHLATQKLVPHMCRLPEAKLFPPNIQEFDKSIYSCVCG